jgi:cytochrome P450
MLWYASGNRDTHLSPDADSFDVTRGTSDRSHCAFGGGGPHRCQGANLTGRVLSVALREMLRRLPDIERAGDISRVQSPFINALATLPVSFTPTG